MSSHAHHFRAFDRWGTGFCHLAATSATFHLSTLDRDITVLSFVRMISITVTLCVENVCQINMTPVQVQASG